MANPDGVQGLGFLWYLQRFPALGMKDLFVDKIVTMKTSFSCGALNGLKIGQFP